MDERRLQQSGEAAFDALLESCVSELPPEDVVRTVTPWKTAMGRILWGMAMGSVTFNFWYLNTILPTIGMVLQLLGFRTLRRENRALGACWLLAGLRMVLCVGSLIWNATILPRPGVWMTILSLALQMLQLLCFRSGLGALRARAGLSRQTGTVTALLLWYGLLCVLSLLQYRGILGMILMILLYVFIMSSLWKVFSTLDEAGYTVSPPAVRLSDRALWILLTAVLAVGIALALLLGGRYPMDWQPEVCTEWSDAEQHLLDLGFPAEVLTDLTAEEIAACAGATQVVVDQMQYHPYGNDALRITGVGVRLPGERERWMIVQHFLWVKTPNFCGTEALRISPELRDGWSMDGEIRGRVLYDRDGITYAVPYHTLGKKKYTYDSILWGEQTEKRTFAEFSMPQNGSKHRGYVCFPIREMKDGMIVDCWIDYIHQHSRFQYPVLTAAEWRMSGLWLDQNVFYEVTDALQFFTHEGYGEIVN